MNDEQLGLELPARPWPQAPQAPADEQREIPLERTIQAEYDAWRGTHDGIEAWRFIRERAKQLSAAVPPGKRKKGALSIDWLVQLARKDLHLSINNDFRAQLARDLIEVHPELSDLIERRRRTAA